MFSFIKHLHLLFYEGGCKCFCIIEFHLWFVYTVVSVTLPAAALAKLTKLRNKQTSIFLKIRLSSYLYEQNLWFFSLLKHTYTTCFRVVLFFWRTESVGFEERWEVSASWELTHWKPFNTGPTIINDLNRFCELNKNQSNILIY